MEKALRNMKASIFFVTILVTVLVTLCNSFGSNKADQLDHVWLAIFPYHKERRKKLDSWGIYYHLVSLIFCIRDTAWKVSKYGVFSGPYFPVFSRNAEIWENTDQKKLHIWTLFRQWEGTRFVRFNRRFYESWEPTSHIMADSGKPVLNITEDLHSL